MVVSVAKLVSDFMMAQQSQAGTPLHPVLKDATVTIVSLLMALWLACQDETVGVNRTVV